MYKINIWNYINTWINIVTLPINHPDLNGGAPYFDLDSIEVEEVWDRSGRTRNGYVEPTEMACQMFEVALDPFVEEMKKYQKLSMFAEAKEYCIGILKGICKFENESTSEYKDWAVDAPSEFFGWVMDEWKEGQKGVTDEELKAMKKAGRS